MQGGGNNVDNFTQIQYNIAGGKDKYEQKKALEMKEAEEGVQEETSTVEEEKKPAKKIVVEKLTVSGIKLKYGAIVIPLPTLTLRNLGEESGGVSIEQFLSIIGNEILSSAMKLGKGLNQLFEMSAIKTTEVINDIGDGAAEASSQVSSAVTNAVSNIGEKSKDVVLGVAEGTKSAASAVGSGAVKAVESVGEGALKAVESVGDGTKKAASAIKNIFKK